MSISSPNTALSNQVAHAPYDESPDENYVDNSGNHNHVSIPNKAVQGDSVDSYAYRFSMRENPNSLPSDDYLVESEFAENLGSFHDDNSQVDNPSHVHQTSDDYSSVRINDPHSSWAHFSGDYSRISTPNLRQDPPSLKNPIRSGLEPHTNSNILVLVSNLQNSTSRFELFKHLSQAGPISDIRYILDSQGYFSGKAVVQYYSSSSAILACQILHQSYFLSNFISVTSFTSNSQTHHFRNSQGSVNIPPALAAPQSFESPSLYQTNKLRTNHTNAKFYEDRNSTPSRAPNGLLVDTSVPHLRSSNLYIQPRFVPQNNHTAKNPILLPSHDPPPLASSHYHGLLPAHGSRYTPSHSRAARFSPMHHNNNAIASYPDQPSNKPSYPPVYHNQTPYPSQGRDRINSIPSIPPKDHPHQIYAVKPSISPSTSIKTLDNSSDINNFISSPSFKSTNSTVSTSMSAMKNTESMTRVFVGNIFYHTTSEALRRHMSQAGKIKHCEVLVDSNGRSRGSGLVAYEDQESSVFAIENLNDSILDGRKLYVRRDREAGRKVYISGLPKSTTWVQLKETFSVTGNVTRAHINPLGTSGSVLFESEESARQAVALYNGSVFGNSTLSVRLDEFV